MYIYYFIPPGVWVCVYTYIYIRILVYTYIDAQTHHVHVSNTPGSCVIWRDIHMFHLNLYLDIPFAIPYNMCVYIYIKIVYIYNTFLQAYTHVHKYIYMWIHVGQHNIVLNMACLTAHKHQISYDTMQHNASRQQIDTQDVHSRVHTYM